MGATSQILKLMSLALIHEWENQNSYEKGRDTGPGESSQVRTTSLIGTGYLGGARGTNTTPRRWRSLLQLKILKALFYSEWQSIIFTIKFTRCSLLSPFNYIESEKSFFISTPQHQEEETLSGLVMCSLKCNSTTSVNFILMIYFLSNEKSVTNLGSIFPATPDPTW